MTERVTKEEFWKAFSVVESPVKYGIPRGPSFKERFKAMEIIRKFVDQQDEG